jgi:hypothetical protein
MQAASTAMQAASTEGAAGGADRRDALAALLVAVALSGLFVAVRREPRSTVRPTRRRRPRSPALVRRRAGPYRSRARR